MSDIKCCLELAFRLSENEQTGLYYTVPLLTTQHSLKWRAVKKEEFEFRESYYDFPVL